LLRVVPWGGESRARDDRGFAVMWDLDLTTFPRAVHAWGMAMPEVSETDFAIIVFREDERWEADVLPVAVTTDLAGFIRALRQQPSIAGTIGMAGIDDYFFVVIRVIGSQVSVLLSDIGAALDYPLAEQVLEYLEIPVPDEDDLDQVLPVGDLSIFADLGLDEMELAAISSRLDLDPDSDEDYDDADHVDDALESIATRLGFGPAVERALDIALGS
jgi:putative tRNA adenosine deaminase-associated protein